MSRFIGPVMVAALALAPVTAAQAQDWRGTPVYGQVSLSAGFVPDPHVIELTAGGGRDAGNLAGGRCTGNIGQNPDFVLRYTAADQQLYIRANSDEDTTIVVRDPAGSWACDDDTNGVNPEVKFPRPASGTYHIWVGTFGDNTASARLEISELTSDSYASGGSLDASANPAFGEVSLRAGFTPDPHSIDMVAGGSIAISSVTDGCPGSVATAPDYRLDYSGNGRNPLKFTFVSDTDTVLLINTSDGAWICDDDSDGDLDPRIVLNSAKSGIYDIWVGTIDGEMAHGTLSISEVR